MKFLTANDACGKLSTSRDPSRAAAIRPEFELVIYEFAWPIHEFELGNSDFRAVWNAALLLVFSALLFTQVIQKQVEKRLTASKVKTTCRF